MKTLSDWLRKTLTFVYIVNNRVFAYSHDQCKLRTLCSICIHANLKYVIIIIKTDIVIHLYSFFVNKERSNC